MIRPYGSPIDSAGRAVEVVSDPDVLQGPAMKSTNTWTFNVQALLDAAGFAKTIVEHPRSGVIFSEGDPCETALDLQEGGVKLSVLLKTGKEPHV